MALQPKDFDFNFYGKRPNELKPDGDTHYPSQPRVLRLTKTDYRSNPLQWSMGRSIYKPVLFGDGKHKISFETKVHFKVTTMENTPYADGLVFFIVPEGHQYPIANGGNLGIFEPPGQRPLLFAVAFDTYSKNPGYLKLGICIHERTPKRFIQVPDSFLGKKLTLTVKYNSTTTSIEAEVTDTQSYYPVSYECDLSDLLAPTVEVGLASSTGEYVAVHDVYSWSFKSDAPQATS